MKLIRKRLTYANVMSSIAVFLILGGATAFAAKKIGSSEIKGNSITTGKIKKEAVTKAKIKNASVDASKLADGAVTTTKIANEAVIADKLAKGTVTTEKIAKDAVTSEKIAKDAVTSEKIAKDAVTSEKIAKDAVTSEKIAKDAVTGEKVNESTLGTVPSAQTLAPGTTGDAKNLVLAYATVAGASTEVINFGGKGVTSVTNTGGNFRTVTFKGSFPGVTSIDDITMLVNTPDSDAFTTCSGNNDSGNADASPTEISVEVFCFSTETTTGRTDPAAIMIMGG